jgi:maleate cis-trans isomerase
MAGALNKQPIFTATPVLACLAFDPVIVTSVYKTADVTIIYDDISTHGSLITKITVNSPLRTPGEQATQKRIYLMISEEGNKSAFDILDSKLMQGDDDYDITKDPPSVVFEFPTGLITAPNSALAIASTANKNTNSYNGDRLVVIVEGGTYDEPA